MSDYNQLVKINSNLKSLIAGGGGINIAELGGNAIATNSGNLSAGTLRVAVASNDVNLSKLTSGMYEAAPGVFVNGSNINFLNANTIATNSGVLSDGVQRVCIASDDVNLGKFQNAFTNVLGQEYLQSSVDRLGGATINLASGAIAGGTQRVCIATDDVNLSALSAAVDVNSNVQTNAIAIGGTMIDVNSGNLSAGCQRVAIATNDVNLSSIAASLTTIAAILTDVWDDGANSLRVV